MSSAAIRKAEKISLKIIVEGGSKENNTFTTEFRKAFQAFFSKGSTRIENRELRLKVIPGCADPVKSFFIELKRSGDSDRVFLLLDSEKEFSADGLYGFAERVRELKEQNNWKKAPDIPDDSIHFMVALMESWFIADKDALKAYYGNRFRDNQIPDAINVEVYEKQRVFNILKAATRDTQKGPYSKTNHSYRILNIINPSLVSKAAPQCKRLLEVIEGI